MRFYTIRVRIDGERSDLTYRRDLPLHKALGYMLKSMRMGIDEGDLRRAARSARRAGARVNWRKVALAMVSCCGSTEPLHSGTIRSRRRAR